MDLNTTFKNLEFSIQESSTWTPSIILSSTMCTMVGNDMIFNMEKSAKSELVDIIKLLKSISDTESWSILSEVSQWGNI